LWFAVFYIAYFTFFKTEVFLETRRFFTSFYPILVIWCAGGVWFAVGMIKNLQFKKLGLWSISAVLLISFFPYWDIKKAGGPQHRLETEIIEKAEAQLPPHCVIVANYPEVLSSTTFLRVINIDDFLQDRAFRDDILNHFSCVLFLEDYPCFYFADIINKCEALKSLVRLEPFKSYAIDKGKGGPGKIVYTFYKISPRDK
jgi:hypothetical protein